MLRFLVVATLWSFSLPAFCQTTDSQKTKARVSFKAESSWFDVVGDISLSSEIKIEGEINQDAVILVHQYYDALAEMLRKLQTQWNWNDTSPSITFHLNSLGGNVDAAIEIGRFLREKRVHAIVYQNERCASACLFILAGAATRAVIGSLGIHRPFLDTASRPMTTEDVKKVATQNQERLRAYFREMNISERLADDMMMIPSEQMRWLSPQEIAVYGLGVDDPVIKETDALKQAQKYGISRIEYETRRKKAQTLCLIGGPADCWDKVMREVAPQRQRQ